MQSWKETDLKVLSQLLTLSVNLVYDGSPANGKKIYLAETRKEARRLNELGIPYIFKSTDIRTLIACLLVQYLIELSRQGRLPDIDWYKVLHVSPKKKILVHYPVKTDASVEQSLNIQNVDGSAVKYVTSNKLGDLIDTDGWNINIDKLIALRLFPQFIGDITDVIRANLSNIIWEEGYNRKLAWPAGNYAYQGQADNLLIIDCSNSMGNIGDQMLMIAQMLGVRLDADIIFTAGRSYYYSKDDELPSANQLRNMMPRSNECIMFQDILSEHIAGRKFGSVIAFGDNDTPDIVNDVLRNLITSGTEIGEVRNYFNRESYHEKTPSPKCGYAKWCYHVSPNAGYALDDTWVKWV